MAWAQGAKINNRSEAKVDGTYINIRVTNQENYVFGERGKVGIPMELDWGSDDDVIAIDVENFTSECKQLLGREYNDPELRNIVEAINGGASQLYIYKLNHGEKATSSIATAKNSGAYGNTIDIVVEQDPDAGVGDHPLKNTTATVEAEENVVSVTINEAPKNATITFELEKEEQPVDKSKYSVSTVGSPATITFEKDVEAGEYKLKTFVNELLLETATLTISNKEATEASMKVQKSGDVTQGADYEELTGTDSISVEVTAEGNDNKVTVQYTGLSETQKPDVKLMADQVVVLQEADKVSIQTGSDNVVCTFGKLFDASKEYSLQINVTTTDSMQTKDYGKQALKITQEGENKPAYTDVAYSTSEKEDYSAPIPNRFIITTYVGGTAVDTQRAQLANELKDNDYVTFNKTTKLEASAGINLTGGTNGTVTGADWEKARNVFESQPLNVIAVPVIDVEEQKIWVEYVKRLRDKYGQKFQIVMPYNEDAPQYNYEGVILYANELTDEDLNANEKKVNLTYWLAGAEAGCAVQSSCVARAYNGSYNVSANVTFKQQEWAIDNGIIMFHLVDGVPTVGKDINTLTVIEPEYEQEKSLQFKQNQAIRVLDAICLDTATIFNTYFLGRVPNDEMGRSDLMSRLIRNRESYAAIGAIDTYDSSYLTLERGEQATDVIGTDAIRFLNVMEYLFFTIEVLG